MPATKIEHTLKKAKDTKNTYRYEAENSEGAPFDTLYVKKSAFTGDAPETIKVTITIG